MENATSRGPVLIDLEPTKISSPADAAPVIDAPVTPNGAAMQQVAAVANRKPSRLAKWFWSITLSLVGFVVSLAAWDYVTNLLARSPVLGGVAIALMAGFILILLGLAIRELAAFRRLQRLDGIHKTAEHALLQSDLVQARSAVAQLNKLYARRDDTAWGREKLAEKQGYVLDADGLLGLAEQSVLAPLDAQAMREIEAAARQVATVTALVPLALADVVTALTANLRMIRPARVGVAAMEVCRPLPFHAIQKPSIAALGKRALTGLGFVQCFLRRIETDRGQGLSRSPHLTCLPNPARSL